ncbi:MAG: MBOAT family protein [Alphaproteobacteria bacterium]
MSLTSPVFLVALAGIFALTQILREGTPRVVAWLVASYAFYYLLSSTLIVVLLFITAITYVGGNLLSGTKNETQRKFVFTGALLLVLAPLIGFKYLHFILGALAGLVTWFGVPVGAPAMELALPIGLSFFTFQALGYLADVFIGTYQSERRLSRVALYLAFFPTVTAGPIQRAGRLIPQLDERRPFESDRMLAALRFILWGLTLKAVLAEILYGKIAKVFGDLASASPLEALFGSIFYTFYIYTDFAGYSLIAIGSGLLLGIKLDPNFRQPFLSTSIPEFWRTWHISLSSWVRDYVFMPLRLKWRHSPFWGLVGAVILSFLIIGVWHGANWTFVVFGLMHGIMAAVSITTQSVRDRLWKAVRAPVGLVRVLRILTTFMFVTISFIVYRADSIKEAGAVFRKIFSSDLLANIRFAMQADGAGAFKSIGPLDIGWLVIVIVLGADILARSGLVVERMPRAIQVVLYNIALLALTYMWIAGNAPQPFLYYRF